MSRGLRATSVVPIPGPRISVLLDPVWEADQAIGLRQLSVLARDIEVAMVAAGFGSAFVASVSLGGMIAIRLALDIPHRVDSLALVCTSATMDRAAWTARVEKVRAEGVEGIVDLAMSRFLSPGFIAERPEVAATVRRGLLAMSPDGYAGCAAAIRDMGLADRLGEIACPTLVATGSRDTSTPFEGHGDHLVGRIVAPGTSRCRPPTSHP